jgi:PIN domain nuclease of toxin-antitoxin system
VTVLDAYAIIAYLRGEGSADEVAALLRERPLLAAANAAEVVDQMVRVWGRDGDDVEGDLALLGHAGLRVQGLDAELALAAGRLRAAHYRRRDRAISLADCVAAATALAVGAPLATADPALAAVVRAEGGTVTALPDSSGRRP